mmetsp:Transcript_23761/g.50873  ORF Transcript_23761/g.50873 Transcript_23761/m.50873 type:complete len:102 (-) Transcript_23761:200-505(-)
MKVWRKEGDRERERATTQQSLVYARVPSFLLKQLIIMIVVVIITIILVILVVNDAHMLQIETSFMAWSKRQTCCSPFQSCQLFPFFVFFPLPPYWSIWLCL